MTSQENKVTTIPDLLTIYEASYSGNRTLLERFFALNGIIEQVNYPDHEWGNRTALHLAASQGKIQKKLLCNIKILNFDCLYLVCNGINLEMSKNNIIVNFNIFFFKCDIEI